MKKPIIIVILLVASALLTILAIFPKMEKSKKLNLQIDQMRQDLKNKEEYFSSLRKISKELQDYQPQLLKINSALPLSGQLPEFFNFLQRKSSESGLVLKDMSSASKTQSKTEGISEFSISLSVSGSYASVKNFISVLERSSRMIEVENVGFLSEKEAGNLSAILKIKIFSL